MRKNKPQLILSVIAFIFFLNIIVNGFYSCKNSSTENNLTDNDAVNSSSVFVGDKVCGSCHAKELADWKISDHYHSMLPATDSTVLGDFNNSTFTADGVTSHFFKLDGKFFINTQNENGSNQDFEIIYTFGYKPLQQYLVQFPGGRMQVTRQCWDTNKKIWFHQSPDQVISSHDWLHWTGRAQNWNSSCAGCHSTNLQTNYNYPVDTFRTTWSSINVSCESCHGSGKNHVDYISSEDYKSGKKISGSLLLLHLKQTSKEQITTCAPCHSRRAAIDESPFQSLQLLNHFIPETPHLPAYNADGQIHDEDYEFNSFSQSKMYTHDVKCSDCHNPHSGKLVKVGNPLCINCHDKKFDSPAHTFHAIDSEGSQCINCHMPSKIYMGNDVRRDHSFRVPRPDQSVKYGTPNACNNCHTNKNAQWASIQIIKWFGPTRQYHFSDDLIPGSFGNFAAAKYLQKLCAPDTNVPAIIHATALYYMSFANDPKNISFLTDGLKNEDALIRYEALNSLKFYPFLQWKSDAQFLLKDSVKAIRIAAADLFLQYADSFNSSYHSSFSLAKNELFDFLEKNSSQPSSRMMKADAESKIKNFNEAEKDYLFAIKMDSLLVQVRLNLATMYDNIGQPQNALRQLKIASAIEPANAHINYFLALLHVELNDNNAALKYFMLATINSKNTKVFYNFGLLLEQMKQDTEAEKIYKKGLQIDAYDIDLNYVLAIFYYNRNKKSLSANYFFKLTQLLPDNVEFKQLYNQVKNE